MNAGALVAEARTTSRHTSCSCGGASCCKQRTRDDIARSRLLFEQAIDIDPSFANPYAGLAFGHLIGYVNQWTETPVQPLATADRLARRSLALDPSDPQSHYAMAAVHLWTRNYDEAIREAATATELDPNFSPRLFAPRASTALCRPITGGPWRAGAGDAARSLLPGHVLAFSGPVPFQPAPVCGCRSGAQAPAGA